MLGFMKGAGLSVADRARVNSLLAIGDALEAAQVATAGYAADALVYRNAAMQAGNVFPTIAAGMAATQVGDYFTVPTGSDSVASTLYRHADFGRTEVAARFPGPSGVARSDRLTDMSRLSWWGASDLFYMNDALIEMAEGFGAAAFSGAINGARLDSIWAEQGSRPMRVRFPGNVIPATAAQQNIEWLNGTPRGSVRSRRVVIPAANVEGVIASNATTLRFNRSNVVSGLTIPASLPGDVEVFCRSAIDWQYSVQLWSVGRNDLVSGEPIQEVMAAYIDAWNKLPTIDRRVMIIGHWAPTGTEIWYPIVAQLAQLDAFYRETFGDRYVPLAPYLNGPAIWADTGITPTEVDLAQQSAGNLAPSLALPNDTVHLNAIAARAVVQNVIRPRLAGWYERVS